MEPSFLEKDPDILCRISHRTWEVKEFVKPQAAPEVAVGGHT
jgi:hypothetical protein